MEACWPFRRHPGHALERRRFHIGRKVATVPGCSGLVAPPPHWRSHRHSPNGWDGRAPLSPGSTQPLHRRQNGRTIYENWRFTLL